MKISLGEINIRFFGKVVDIEKKDMKNFTDYTMTKEKLQ